MTKAIPYSSLWGGILLWVLMAGGLAAGTGYLLYQDFLFTYRAKPVEAVVDRKHIVTSHSRRGGTSHTPHLAYHYQVNGVEPHEDVAVSSSTYDQARVGHDLPILYVTSDVTDSRIDLPDENTKIRWLSWGLVAATVLVSGLGWWLTVYFHKRNKLHQWLKSSGMACTGLVTDKVLKLVNKGRQERFLLIFMFRSPQGEEISGESWMLMPKQAELWKTGDPIRVYVDPANARRFTVDVTPPGSN